MNPYICPAHVLPALPTIVSISCYPALSGGGRVSSKPKVKQIREIFGKLKT